MKTAIELIRDAYDFVGIPGVTLDGKFSKEGLGFLNELLYNWNTENYFPFTQNTIDGHVNGGQALIGPGETLDGEKPINVSIVLYKSGSNWIKLKRVSYENIWERRNTCSQPVSFAFTNDEQGRGVVVFDSENGNFDVRVIYNRNIPTMGFNDVLATPPQYEQAIKYGIAALASVARGMPPEMTAKYEKLRDDIIKNIKKANSFKHSIDAPVYGTPYESPAERLLTGRHL